MIAISTVPEQQANGLQLRTFFVVRDKATGRVIPPNKIEQARYQLPDEEEAVSAILEDPTTPIKIALLLDESGSMKPYVAGVRAAAKDAIAKAPDQAQFAIFRFSDVASQGQITPSLDFTPKADSATINSFIDTQYDLRPNAPTCLYNIALGDLLPRAERQAGGAPRNYSVYRWQGSTTWWRAVQRPQP